MFKNGETEAAIKIYTKLADDKNYTKAKTRLGILYTDNDTVKPNYKLGIKYLTEASASDSVAMRFLMVEYMPQRINALKIGNSDKLERLANNNIKNNRLLDVSYYWLGRLADSKSDYALAFYYYDKSASCHYAPAYSKLGTLFYSGVIGGQKKYEKASKYFYKALSIDSGDNKALFYLGQIYMLGGHGVDKNVLIAYRFYQKAANLGNEFAGRRVAIIKMNEPDF